MMNALFLSGSISRQAGGVFTSMRRLAQSVAASEEISIRVIGLRDRYSNEDLPSWLPLKPELVDVVGLSAFGFAPGLSKMISMQSPDLIHVHGLWQYPSFVSHRYGRKHARPYLISPRGMLDAWALENSRVKKRLAGLLYEDAHLRGATCIHALSESEANAIRAYGLKNPICIIPNGIDVAKPADIQQPCDGAMQATSRIGCRQEDPLFADHKVLLYLGRIHPKKGLVNLVRAWQKVQEEPKLAPDASEWMLVIAGWDQGGHEAELKRLATELRIAWQEIKEGNGDHVTSEANHPSAIATRTASLTFMGPQFGADKAAAYRRCDACILPSFSEGLPMAVLEAWSYGKPVLMTSECNLPEGFTAGAAIRIASDLESIADGIRTLISAPSGSNAALGMRGQALVATKFSWPSIAGEMRTVYEWLLGGGATPSTVVMK